MKSRTKNMPETMYRASRYFRVLGNPTAYMILRTLEHDRKTPGELSEELGKSLETISITLRHLRQINMVRYQAKGRTKEYWIKDKGVLELLNKSEELVERMRKKRK
ncbi:ArsR/SmtB family transcription factor [Planctomycetota bacterium]